MSHVGYHDDGRDIVEYVECDTPQEPEVNTIVGYGAAAEKLDGYETEHVGDKHDVECRECDEVHQAECDACNPDHGLEVAMSYGVPD